MTDCSVIFYPQNIEVKIKKGKTILDALSLTDISLSNLCGGRGICGRCKVKITEGNFQAEESNVLSKEEIDNNIVLACLTKVNNDLKIEIPEYILAHDKHAEKDALRYKDSKGIRLMVDYEAEPLVIKAFLQLKEPDLENNIADHQNICEMLRKKLKITSAQMKLPIIRTLPEILRKSQYQVTATIGLRREFAEVMNIEEGNTVDKNFMIIIDIGTTSVVAHLVNASSKETIKTTACFNSQSIYGREVTSRIIAAEKNGHEKLQDLIIKDINTLISELVKVSEIDINNIYGVVCVGNTIMEHFLLNLPTQYIRRTPYIATSVDPPPLRASELGIHINPRGLLYPLPGISGWVGSDLTAGILATGMYENDEVSLLVDIGTNGEVIIGNKEWMMAASASTGPALEGASVDCGMRAETGAIEKVLVENEKIIYKTIGQSPIKGLCGSGIIDLVAVLLKLQIINRSGKMNETHSDKIKTVDNIKRYIITHLEGEKPVYISETDIENLITAKAAVYAAIKILLNRLEMDLSDVKNFYIAGGFGNYINAENAIAIGLIPNIKRERIKFVGNTAIQGAKMVAFNQNFFYKIEEIRKNTTYYDLMGANDYVQEFQKAMFLPHTDIEEFK